MRFRSQTTVDASQSAVLPSPLFSRAIGLDLDLFRKVAVEFFWASFYGHAAILGYFSASQHL